MLKTPQKKEARLPLEILITHLSKNPQGWMQSGSVQHEFHCWLYEPNETLAVSSSFFVPKNAQEWLKNGEKGISSKVIFGAITGLWLDNYDWTPADPSDFNRCYKLIKQVPEWRQELYKVSLISKEWKNVVDNWDKLSEMLENRDKEMYSFMKTLGC